jgi:hypothetical protein
MGMGASLDRSVRCECYVEAHWSSNVKYLYVIAFRGFLGNVVEEFLQRVSVVPHGTLGSYLRKALHGGFADPVDCFADFLVSAESVLIPSIGVVSRCFCKQFHIHTAGRDRTCTGYIIVVTRSPKPVPVPVS